MNQEVRISVLCMDGGAHTATVDKFSCVQSLLAAAGIKQPDGSRAIFMAHDCVLNPHLSLACQNIDDGASVTVLFRKKKRHVRTFDDDRLIRQFEEIERSNSDYCTESLRLADVSFLAFESSKACHLLYLKQAVTEIHTPFCIRAKPATVVGSRPDSVSKDPLPPCWMLDDMQSILKMLPPSPSLKHPILKNVSQNLFM